MIRADYVAITRNHSLIGAPDRHTHDRALDTQLHSLAELGIFRAIFAFCGTVVPQNAKITWRM